MITRRENLNSIYVLLFLNIAFFLLERQDPQKYVALFSFQRDAFLSGEVWRLFTFQFLQGSALSFFFNLLILYIMGGAVEEHLGTTGFLTLFGTAIVGTAAVPFIFGFPLINSVFFETALLFVYAHLFPKQVFYIFFVLPVKVTWLAYIALGLLMFGVFGRSLSSLAALVGSGLTFGVYLLLERRSAVVFHRPVIPERDASNDADMAEGNLARFTEVERALAGSEADRQVMEAKLEKAIVPGVNICPPRDFKPRNDDRYCVRCEGFAECSLRYMKMQMPKASEPSKPAVETS